MKGSYFLPRSPRSSFAATGQTRRPHMCMAMSLLVIMHAPARARQCLSKTEKLNQIPGVGLFGLEVRLGGGLEATFDGRVGRGGEGVRLGLCLHWLPALFVEHVVLEEELRGGDTQRRSEAIAGNQRQVHAIREDQRKAAQSKTLPVAPARREKSKRRTWQGRSRC